MSISTSVCNWSGPDRSHGPKIRTGPKFGTGPRTGPSELPNVQYIFSVLKINVANLAAFVVKEICAVSSQIIDYTIIELYGIFFGIEISSDCHKIWDLGPVLTGL